MFGDLDYDTSCAYPVGSNQPTGLLVEIQQTSTCCHGLYAASD